MNYWLVKSEPGAWSWEDQCAARNKTTCWDGVRNAQATIHLRAMTRGDLVFFYHSGRPKEVVGIVEVVREHYPDPTDPEGKAVAVDVKAVESLRKPVSLKQIKAESKFTHLALVRQSRLSVMPVDAISWKRILKLGGM